GSTGRGKQIVRGVEREQVRQAGGLAELAEARQRAGEERLAVAGTQPTQVDSRALVWLLEQVQQVVLARRTAAATEADGFPELLIGSTRVDQAILVAPLRELPEQVHDDAGNAAGIIQQQCPRAVGQ